MTGQVCQFWLLEEGEENPRCFTLDVLTKGESNEIHSIALHKMVLN